MNDPNDEPIAELRGLREEPSAGFVSRLRNRIERRRLSNDFVGLGWHLPGVVLLAFVEMIFSAFPGRTKGGPS